MSRVMVLLPPPFSRTPQGVRGLKCNISYGSSAMTASHPARGAWIEIALMGLSDEVAIKSHPARGAWIEINNDNA